MSVQEYAEARRRVEVATGRKNANTNGAKRDIERLRQLGSVRAAQCRAEGTGIFGRSSADHATAASDRWKRDGRYWSDAEVGRLAELADDPAYRPNGRHNFVAITVVLNAEFHAQNPVRNCNAVSVRLRKFRKGGS